MATEEKRPQTFVEQVLAFLEERFPWLGSEPDEPVSGAEVIDELCELHERLVGEGQKARRKKYQSKT